MIDRQERRSSIVHHEVPDRSAKNKKLLCYYVQPKSNLTKFKKRTNYQKRVIEKIHRQHRKIHNSTKSRKKS